MIAKLCHHFTSLHSYVNGIQHGKFAQSTGGNLKCEHIFYACVSHWKGENGPQVSLLLWITVNLIFFMRRRGKFFFYCKID